MSADNADLRELVAEVAAAYFSNTHIAPADIPLVLSQIASSLQAVGAAVEAPSEETAQPVTQRLTPAQVRKSITPDGLISFEDNKSYKILRRHLTTRGRTIQGYRAKWGLPPDYPSVAPNYSAARSQMAKSLGLGRKAGSISKGSAKEATPKRGRGRPRKVAAK